jgi:hypothetical protein
MDDREANIMDSNVDEECGGDVEVFVIGSALCKKQRMLRITVLASAWMKLRMCHRMRKLNMRVM